MTNTDNINRNFDSFALNREIAYKGELGRLREEYCRRYIDKKREIFEGLKQEHLELVRSRSETISCGKGCSTCCCLFVNATLQEAEAICYYLYQNEALLAHFLENYPGWRSRVKEAGDPFRAKEGETASNREEKAAGGGKMGDLGEYWRNRIPCPFLADNACSIYPVRPVMCAGLIVTSPSEWCDPQHPDYARKKPFQITNRVLLEDRTFYGMELERPVWSFFPMMVHNILEWGPLGIPDIPGKEELANRFMDDPQVHRIIVEHLRRAKGGL
jgi:Fe-S-cluster containining protein